MEFDMCRVSPHWRGVARKIRLRRGGASPHFKVTLVRLCSRLRSSWGRVGAITERDHMTRSQGMFSGSEMTDMADMTDMTDMTELKRWKI